MDTGVTAAIPAGPFVVDEIIIFQQVLRPFTEEEIEQLPPHPPSIREKAREQGGFVTEETARSDGTTPLPVPAGATVFVTVRLATKDAPDIAATTLVLDGASWGRIEVPVVVMSGAPIATAECVPPEINRIAIPGEVSTAFVSVMRAPEAATVLATLRGAGQVVRITHALAFVGERREFTEEEIAELPPHPPSIREDARRDGYIEYRETARAAAGDPLPVPRGARMHVHLEIAVPEASPPDAITDTLTLYSTTWRRIDVPIRVAIGDIHAVLSANAVSVRQGLQSDVFNVALTSVAGSDTDVQFRLGRDGDPFQVDPPLIRLPRGQTITVPVRVSVDPDPFLGAYPLYLGDYDLGFEVRAFDALWSREFPLRLTFLPGTVTVTALQPSIVALQGDRASCQVQVIVSGGYKRLTFEAGDLPFGIQMAALTWETQGPSNSVLRLDFAIHPDARPVTDHLATVRWSANDGVHTGTLQLPVTVIRRPESRMFSQPVITPAGTALGGHVELELHNDGSGRFRGHMRATGFPSYDFRVRAVVRSSSGRIAVVAQKTGSVYGTDTPGDREFRWDDNAPSEIAADQWPEIRTGSLIVNKSYEMSGLLGALSDVVVDVIGFIATAGLLSPVIPGGAALAGAILIGSELGDLTDVRVVGPGGLVGFVGAAGSAFLFGGGVAIPVLVGMAVGDLSVQHRPLRDHEESFARQVFQDTIPYERVLVTNLSGLGGREFVVPNVDGSILVNLGNGFSDPIGHVDPPRGYTEQGQIFIHEMTHVWQVAHEDVTLSFFWKAALDKLAESASYQYGPPGPPWSSFGLEAQATIVEEWSSGTSLRAVMGPVPGRSATPGGRMQDDDPYFHYIANNIRMGET
jgi:hypothetical protein